MISWLRSWLRACEMLSTSFVARLSTSPRRCSSKWLDGSRWSFSFHGAAEPVADALHRGGGQGALDPAEERRPDVHGGNRQQQPGQPLFVEGAAQEPSTTTSVASPRTLGAATLSVTNAQVAAMTPAIRHFNGRSRPSSRAAVRHLMPLRSAGPPPWSRRGMPAAAHGASSSTSWDAAISW